MSPTNSARAARLPSMRLSGAYGANFGAPTCNPWKWLDVEESRCDGASSRRRGQTATTEHSSDAAAVACAAIWIE